MIKLIKIKVIILVGLVFFGCKNNENLDDVKINTSQGMSLLNTPLIRRQVNPAQDSLQIVKYLDALENYENNNKLADNIIWLGRRIAYLGDYKRAIEIFTQGINEFPKDARFLRHRGHRYISTRQFNNAITDFENAVLLIKDTEDVIEPDGVPNRLNQPVSSLHNNIYYHLGLAYYLKNDLKNALKYFTECLEVSKNNDMQVATRHWLYMILQRMNMKYEAASILNPITENMDIIENIAYHDLLLFYKGVRSENELLKVENGSIGANEATQYGIANWHFYNGDEDRAINMFQNIIKNGNWAGFGYIAAEADLSRLQ
ncbi:tetratricopeptide repeat protein [Flavobacteriaceae bacterium S0825]|uniref:tetratricopeptide repeat protein n=1 Tax=Gaetbulibacter sp. S0825 TaxID=2720084 RepID=UPI001FCAC79A|nr:tetratricopeptide repeat protein [Gaetbulibacter sp. S0825]MCK0109415.1 tetratricopeptide repeat protein [Flavobacteriaceae bacterium S0825]